MQWWIRRKRRFTTRPLPRRQLKVLNATQGKVKGFDLAVFQRSHVVMVGAGGIGSVVATGLVRKGIGELTLLDDDRVETANLTRQLFGRHDVGVFKTIALGRRLASEGLFKTKVTAIPRRLQEVLERGLTVTNKTVLIGGVDNNASRRAVAELAHREGLPAIHAAMGTDGNRLYVFVQEPGAACWGCAFPHYVDDRTYPCGLPGIIDCLMVVSGIIVYTVDTLISDRRREWNLREISLDGSIAERSKMVARNPDCVICGKQPNPEVLVESGVPADGASQRPGQEERTSEQ